jgi:hypothetical protein
MNHHTKTMGQTKMARLCIRRHLAVLGLLCAAGCDSGGGDNTPADPVNEIPGRPVGAPDGGQVPEPAAIELATGCAELMPCGGDPAGAWTLTSGCRAEPVLTEGVREFLAAETGCEALTYTVDETAEGSLSFADGVARIALVNRVLSEAQAPASCGVHPQDCALMGESLRALSGFAEVACRTVDDACHCAAGVESLSETTRSYRVEGDQVLLLTANPEAGEAVEASLAFCVEVGRLRLLAPLGPGPETQLAFAGDGGVPGTLNGDAGVSDGGLDAGLDAGLDGSMPADCEAFCDRLLECAGVEDDAAACRAYCEAEIDPAVRRCLVDARCDEASAAQCLAGGSADAGVAPGLDAEVVSRCAVACRQRFVCNGVGEGEGEFDDCVEACGADGGAFEACMLTAPCTPEAVAACLGQNSDAGFSDASGPDASVPDASVPDASGPDASVLPVRCALPIDPGECVEQILVWGFDGGACAPFAYGGCGGNENNFFTQVDCEHTCLGF